jgi:cytoskeletal protein CcmA (bactofilin family)
MIGKSVRIMGDLSGSEDLMVDGELQGTIRLPGARLTIGATARVRGNIAAKDVVIFGLLDGDIWATGHVDLRASAMVQGNMYAGTFSIEENAAFRGQVDPARAQESMPAAAAALLQRPRGTVPTVRSTAASNDSDSESARESAPLFAEIEA